MTARRAVGIVAFLLAVAGGSRAGFSGGAGGSKVGPDIASVFDSTLNAYLAGPILATFTATGVSVSGALNHEGVACDTTVLSADGFAFPESLAYTGAFSHASRFLVATPNCTTQVWLTRASGTSLLRKDAWIDDFNAVSFSGFIGPEEVLSVYIKPALVPVNPPNPSVTLMLWRFARVID